MFKLSGHYLNFIAKFNKIIIEVFRMCSYFLKKYTGNSFTPTDPFELVVLIDCLITSFIILSIQSISKLYVKCENIVNLHYLLYLQI